MGHWITHFRHQCYRQQVTVKFSLGHITPDLNKHSANSICEIKKNSSWYLVLLIIKNASNQVKAQKRQHTGHLMQEGTYWKVSRDEFISFSCWQAVDWLTGEVQIKWSCAYCPRKYAKQQDAVSFKGHWWNSFKINYWTNHYGQTLHSVLGNTWIFREFHLNKSR